MSMRRRPFLTTYLVLLFLSTLGRWRVGAFERRELPTFIWERGTRSPIVVLLDERVPGPGGRALFDLQLQDHHVTMHRGGADALTLFGDSSAHLIAFGSSGPAAIDLAATAPHRVRSLVLIDADGIEEFDLLGDHHLNQVLRRGQVTATEVAKALVPHFGILDILTRRTESRARSLLRYDQRGIRDELARWDGPTAIIIRGDRGGVAATGHEHHRLLPQSELVAWRRDSLPAFLDRVDAGTASTRVTADPARVAAAALPFDAGGLASAQGVSLLVVLALLALTTLLSEDVACIAAGVLAARGSIPLLPGIVACYVGIVLGDQLLYLLGRSAGRALVTRAPIRWILPGERLERACAWFATHGMRVVLISRVLPGTRFPVYLAAGILRAGFARFATWLMVVGAIWTPLLVGLSYEATRRGRGTLESLPGATWIWALLAMGLGAVALRWGVGWLGHRWAGRTPMDEP